jgi:signal transduction histidine kinase
VSRLRRLAPTTWLTAAVLVLLPALALLQYRWLSHVGADAASRMREVAANAARALAVDLAYEVTRAWRERAGVKYAIPGETARGLAPLVADALVVDGDDASPAGEPRVRRWDLDAGTCEPVAWPAGYNDVRAEMLGHLRDVGGRAGRELLASLRREGAVLGFVPVGIEDGTSPHAALRPPCGTSARVVVLFRLDLEVLRQTLLPELARRHLAALQPDFRFAVVAGPEGRDVIYTSPGADAAALAATPDVVVPVGFWQWEQERGGRGGRGSDAELPAGAEVVRGSRGHGGRREGWVLVGQHRAGSLDAAVAALRTRNLAISFGILLLMGVAVALIAANARRAERLAQQQVDFVAAVSHEMRTPVSAIDVTAKNLEDGLIADPARVKRYGAVIRAEARRLGETVERVLQFAALDVGRGIGALVDVDLGAVVEDVAVSARRDHPGARVELEIEGPLGAVRADAPVLRSCVQNLVGNALKYGGHPGWVRVRVGRADGPASEVRVSVEDRGPGIDKRDVPHVFEPFYRGTIATEQRIPGNGLGLHIVKRSIEMMGGSVSLRTERDRGTTVTLHVPLRIDGNSRTRTREPGAARSSPGA